MDKCEINSGSHGKDQEKKDNDFVQRFKTHLQNLNDVNSRALDIKNAILDRGQSKNGYYPIDVTYKAVVCDKQKKVSAFLLCSNQFGKELVFRNFSKAKKIKQLLGKVLGDVVSVPFCNGHFEGVSWALYDLHLPLATSRGMKNYQRIFVVPRVTKWLNLCLVKTKREILADKISETILNPLQILESNVGFPSSIRRKSADIITEVEKGTWCPYTAVSHNDLWNGNVLLPSSHTRTSAKFMIIDWAGSEIDGIPLFDLVKFCQSFNAPKMYSRFLIKTQCDLLNCETKDSISYLVVALAVLGTKLDQFSPDAYVRISKMLFEFNHKVIF